MAANANFDQYGSSQATRWLNKNYADAVFNGRVLLAVLKRDGMKRTITGGKTLIEPVMEAQNTTNAWASAYDEVDLTPQTGLTAAEFNWKIAFGSIVMSEAEKAWNRGEGSMINLWEAKYEQEVDSAQNFLNDGLFDDNSANPKAITGLESIVAATGTYGNISRTSNTFWRAQVDSTSEALTLADMRDMFHNVSKNIARPNIIITTQTLYTKAMTFADTSFRQEDARTATLGFQSVQFMGVPIVYDDACTSGTMYFLNSKFLKFYVQEGWDFKWSDIRQPTRQLVDARIMRFMGQLVSNNPRLLGKLSNKTA